MYTHLAELYGDFFALVLICWGFKVFAELIHRFLRY